MKKTLIFLGIFYCFITKIYSQTSGTITFDNTTVEGINSIGPYDSNRDLRINGERSIHIVINEEDEYTDGAFNVFVDGPSDNPLFRITQNGLVGIGVANPNYKLQVNGDISLSGYLRNKSINPKPSDVDNIFDHMDYDLIDLGAQAGSGNEITAIKLTSAVGQTTFGTRLIQEDKIFRIQCGYGKSNPYALIINGENGNIGVGTSTPGHLLDVAGTIHTKEIKVDMNGWSDFVFHPNYNLRPLQEVNTYIQQNGHLPEIPTAKEVEENGISLGEMNAKLLQKIEELTLYMIEQQKLIEKILERTEKQDKIIEELLKK